MADNVAITAGSGTSVATDDVGGAHIQRVKLTSGAEGSAAAVGTDERGYYVDPRPNSALVRVASAGLTTATTAYIAGDQLGTIITIAGAARATGGTGTVTSITLLDKADIIGAVEVVFFRASVTLAADNAPFDVSDADLHASVIGSVVLPYATDLGGAGLASLTNVGLRYDCAATDLFAALITRTGHTFFAAVDDLTLVVALTRD